jgi:hypothetical protein
VDGDVIEELLVEHNLTVAQMTHVLGVRVSIQLDDSTELPLGVDGPQLDREVGLDEDVEESG